MRILFTSAHGISKNTDGAKRPDQKLRPSGPASNSYVAKGTAVPGSLRFRKILGIRLRNSTLAPECTNGKPTNLSDKVFARRLPTTTLTTSEEIAAATTATAPRPTVRRALAPESAVST